MPSTLQSTTETTDISRVTVNDIIYSFVSNNIGRAYLINDIEARKSFIYIENSIISARSTKSR